GGAAPDLALDEERVDDGAAVVHGPDVLDARLAAVGVDADDGYRGAEAVGLAGRVVVGGVLQAERLARGQLAGAAVGGGGDLAPAHRLLGGAGDAEAAVLELDIVGVGLEQAGGDALRLVDHRVGGLDERG